MFDCALVIVAICVFALFLALYLGMRIRRCVEECRKEKEAELLRAYPELSEIFASQPARDTHY
jgi:hypothetical protein